MYLQYCILSNLGDVLFVLSVCLISVVSCCPLCPWSFTNKFCFSVPLEADSCSKELNLRLNKDGYLTGDMSLVLPPIRGINLHPFTG